MIAALAGETARRCRRTVVVDTLAHIWLTSIYGRTR